MLFKRRSLAEIKERGRQGGRMVAERIGLSNQLRLPDDGTLLDLFRAPSKVNAVSGLLEYVRNRDSPALYPSFEEPAAVEANLRKRFADHSSNIVEKADRICEGKFDLLGYADLFFQSMLPDWHFDPVSGKTSPKHHWTRINELDPSTTGDKKVVWELNRHQYFSHLGQAYWLTGDERYAETFVAHLESWFDANPPKTGINWLSSLEIAFRCISWILAFEFFKGSPHFTPETFVRMLKFLYLQGRHLENYLSTYFSPNTHLTGEALGLYFLGAFLPELRPAARWRENGYRTLMNALEFQVRRDGVYCEQSSHYQRYTADFYANLLILRRRDGYEIDPTHIEKYSALMDLLLHCTQPDGNTPLFGDDDGGRLFFLDNRELTDFRPTLALGAVLLDRGDLKFAAGEPTAELLWLLGPKGLKNYDEIPATKPDETAKAFNSGGYFIARDRWAEDADHIVIDGGPHGFLNGGHAHADALNVLLSVSGRPLFIDSGTYTYTSDPAARDRFRSTAAHNCLTVDGRSSSTPAGPFSWRSTAESRVIEWNNDGGGVSFRGAHDGFSSHGVDYEREVDFCTEKQLTITDRLSSREMRRFDVTFILAPGLSATIEGGGVAIAEQDDQIALIETQVSASENVSEAVWTVEEWEVSYRYGSLRLTKRLRLSLTGAGNLLITNQVRWDRAMFPRLQRPGADA